MLRTFTLTGVALLVCVMLKAHASAQSSPELESNTFTLITAVAHIDTDSDGMPDIWETAHGLNPVVADAAGNPDGDSLTNIQEYNAGSDPQVFESNTVAFAVSATFTVQTRTDAPDQDGDALPDAWEIANGLNPAIANANADPDGDGLTNLQEFNGGWNPLVADNAALSSSQSALFLADTGAYSGGYTLDTDSDGMPDWWEVQYGLNRLVNDATGNPDGDDLNNLQEYLAGRIPNRDDLSGEVQQPSALFALDTIGLAPDTDHDGLPDAWETAHGLNPLVADANGDPDGDGRTNLEEYNAGTDPQVNDWLGPVALASLSFLLDTGAYPGGYSLDSDGDGMPDWWEARYGLLINLASSGGNPDGDDLTNLQEYNAGTNPLVYDFLFVIQAEGNVFVLDTGGVWLDTDADGLPDWWERMYTGSITAMQPNGDLDGDGSSNLDEFTAGLSPVDGASRFRISNSWIQDGPSGRELVVRWESKPSRFYRIFTTENLGVWPSSPDYEVTGDGLAKTCACALGGAKHLFVKIEVYVVHP